MNPKESLEKRISYIQSDIEHHKRMLKVKKKKLKELQKENDNKSFDNLVNALINEGYIVTISLESKYRFASIKGKNIIGGFCEPNSGDSYRYIDGKVSFDNEKCFDKWSKCPYSLPIPKTEKEFQYLLSKIEYMSSVEGFNKSNNYDLEIETNYPENINL